MTALKAQAGLSSSLTVTAPIELSSSLTVAIEEIGPKMAQEYIMSIDLQRQVNRADVISYARQMTQGQWKFTGLAIIFDVNGNLLNGQHQLKAIVHSGTTQRFLVVRGVDTDAFDVMDTGRRRSYKDALFIAGFSQPERYGGLANKMIKWERMIYFGGAKHRALSPTNQEIVDYCEENRKDLAETINYSLQIKDRLKDTKVMTVGNLSFLYHMFKESNKGQAFDFIERMITGYDADKVPKYQPIDKVRKRLIQNTNDDAKLPQKLVVLMTIAAWNAYRQNKRLHSLDGTDSLIKAVGKKIKIF